MKQVNERCAACNTKENVYDSGYGQNPLCLKCLDEGMEELEAKHPLDFDLESKFTKDSVWDQVWLKSIKDATHLIQEEYLEAVEKFTTMFNSYHEAYAVIKEELDELWVEIKDKHSNRDSIGLEAKQIGAMALALLIHIDIHETIKDPEGKF